MTKLKHCSSMSKRFGAGDGCDFVTINDLPDIILSEILIYVVDTSRDSNVFRMPSTIKVTSFALVCRHWKDIAYSPLFWGQSDLSIYIKPEWFNYSVIIPTYFKYVKSVCIYQTEYAIYSSSTISSGIKVIKSMTNLNRICLTAPRGHAIIDEWIDAITTCPSTSITNVAFQHMMCVESSFRAVINMITSLPNLKRLHFLPDNRYNELYGYNYAHWVVPALRTVNSICLDLRTMVKSIESEAPQCGLYPKITELTLCGSSGVVPWSVLFNSLPNLRMLVLRDINQLSSFAEYICTLDAIHPLDVLRIVNCKSSVSFEYVPNRHTASGIKHMSFGNMDLLSAVSCVNLMKHLGPTANLITLTDNFPISIEVARVLAELTSMSNGPIIVGTNILMCDDAMSSLSAHKSISLKIKDDD